jgi:hypothetical protein
MNTVLSDCFIVYAQQDGVSLERPGEMERELASCGSYGEAHRIRQDYQRAGVHCVIRFVGPVGGGD